MKICSVEFCDKKVRTAGMCIGHYLRKWKGTPMDTPWRKTPINGIPNKCSVDGCDFKYKSGGFCGAHYQRIRNGAKSTGPIKNIRRKGEGGITPTGYKIIAMPSHPNAQKSGRIFEHVVIMSHKIGRALFKHETVHHINGMRCDNRPENLELWSKSQPFGQRVEDKIAWMKEFLHQYGYQVQDPHPSVVYQPTSSAILA